MLLPHISSGDSPPIPYSSKGDSWPAKPHIQLILTVEHNVNEGIVCYAVHAKIGSDPNCHTRCCVEHDAWLPVWIHLVVTNANSIHALRIQPRLLRARRVTRPVWTEGYQQQADLLELSAERYLPTFLWKTSNKTLVGTCPDKTTMPQLGLDGCFFVLVCFA